MRDSSFYIIYLRKFFNFSLYTVLIASVILGLFILSSFSFSAMEILKLVVFAVVLVYISIFFLKG